MIVINILMKGNAYILIDRSLNGKVIGLTLLNSDFVKAEIVNNDVIYNDLNSKKTYDKSQIIHIMNYTFDGFTGVSTLFYAATSLGIAYSSEEHTSNFWKSGGNMAGILRPIAGSTMNKTQAAKAKTDLVTQLSTDLGGSGSGSIVVLGDGLEYQPISVNPKDSQLLESR